MADLDLLVRHGRVVDELREHNGDLAPADRAGLFGLNALAMYGIEPAA